MTNERLELYLWFGAFTMPRLGANFLGSDPDYGSRIFKVLIQSSRVSARIGIGTYFNFY